MLHTMIEPELIARYNKPVPRYTSYPTVPFWQDQVSIAAWTKNFSDQFAIQNRSKGISLYIHLPFCESLCTYCGCNKKITSNHVVENAYIYVIAKEWNLYRELMTEQPVIREIHLGGGTPTFFSSQNLERLLQLFLSNSIIHPYYSFSIEGHPNNTTRQQLDTLFTLGFRRISYGVQDLDPEVQRVINRIQPAENVKRATDAARDAGFSSVNFDLIYGLPLQTIQSIDATIREVISLKPERIAFYSYAHVPWMSRSQRLFDEGDLPSAEEKIKLYLYGRSLLLSAGYHDIGMDHFALAGDELYIAKKENRLHRNFMGYTVQDSEILLGLGVSAISDTGNAFVQNNKTLHDYYNEINNGGLPVTRGYFLHKEDMRFRNYIKNIACNGYTIFSQEDVALLKNICFPLLEEFVKDGLVTYNEQELQLTAKGNYFVRNICSAFDLHLQRREVTASTATFSNAI